MLSCELSPGQTDRQVVASGRKLNLRRELALGGQTNSQVSFHVHAKYMQVTKKYFLGRLSSISLANNRFMDSLSLRWLTLCGQRVKKVLWLACKFDLDQSERKSSQVNASTRKLWPNGVASRPTFSTCVYLRRRLTRALSNEKSGS